MTDHDPINPSYYTPELSVAMTQCGGYWRAAARWRSSMNSEEKRNERRRFFDF